MAQLSSNCYGLEDLLDVVKGIDNETIHKHLNAEDMQRLEQHSALCKDLKQAEEQPIMSTQTPQKQVRLNLTTPSGISTERLSERISGSTQPLRPPISKHARMMWPRVHAKPLDEAVKIKDFAVETSSIDNGIARSPADDTQRRPKFENERDRQLYYRPREWRTRKRGEWADTGPFRVAQQKEETSTNSQG